MNRSKAQDFYSDYYEGTLEAGLREVFERALANDAELHADYEAFCGFMNDISEASSEEADEPAFLHEKIMGRVEASISESRRVHSGWRAWLKPLMTFGVAATVIGGVFFAMNARGGGPTQASLFASSSSTKTISSPNFFVKNGDVFVEYSATSPVKITIRRKLGGEVMESFDVANEVLQTKLTNDAETSELITVAVEGEDVSRSIILPGTNRKVEKSGEGSVLDYAKALAGVYNKPVEIQLANPGAPAAWTLGGVAAMSDAKPAGLSLELRASGVLFLSD